MATDLKKVFSINGQQGLFWYLSQARTGVIVESLMTKKRSCAPLSSKMTSMYDISIYTDEGEVKLQDVFERMKAKLGDKEAPSGKSAPELLKAFFEELLPEYDRDRFYVSHMKKVVEWYNCLKEYASLDFTKEDENTGESAETAEEKKVE